MLAAAREWAATCGSTEAERAATYPAQRLLPDAGLTAYRAVDVAAPAEVVYRWLCQLRVAPYSYDLLDNWGRRSPRTLTPGLDDLAVGQRVMTIFDLAEFEPGRSMTVTMRPGRATWLFGPVAVTYDVRPLGADRSRLLAVVCAARSSRLLLWGDAVMMRKQLRTLAHLAEG